jgi:hypothetical protein
MAIVWVSSMSSKVPSRARQPPQRFMESGLRRYHADIGHMRLGENEGDVARRERGLERRDVVELDDLDEARKIEAIRADAVLGRGMAVAQLDLGLVDRAVILAVEHQDLLAAGDEPGDAHGEAVGVARRDGDLPIGQAETVGEGARDDDRVLGRQHIGGAAARDLARHDLGDGRIGMAEERGGIAEAEIDIAMAVDILQPRADRPFGEDRKRAAPLAHPMQGHAMRHVPRGLRVQRPRARMRRDEALFLTLPECGEHIRFYAVARCLVR